MLKGTLAHYCTLSPVGDDSSNKHQITFIVSDETSLLVSPSSIICYYKDNFVGRTLSTRIALME
jgi:hypothetical protein